MAGTARTRAQLTTEPGAPFRTGNVPTNGDFQNLVASSFHLLDDDASRITVDPVSQDFLEAELGVLPLEAGGVRALLAGVINKIVSLLPFTVRTVDTIAELRALPGDTRREVYVRGTDGIGTGLFRFDATRTAEDDGIGIVVGWVRQLREVASLKEFGAVGDGVADDTAAITAAIQSGLPLDWGGYTYRTTAGLELTSPNPIRWRSNGATLFVDGSSPVQYALYIKVPAGHSYINGLLQIDANLKAFVGFHIENDGAIAFPADWSDFYANGLSVRNVYRSSTVFTGGDGIWVRGAFRTVNLDSPIVENCRMASGAGVFGSQGIFGITVTGNTAGEPQNIFIINPYVDAVLSEDDTYTFDQDGIRVIASPAASAPSEPSCKIIGGTIRNAYGRGVKIQCEYGLVSGTKFVRTQGFAKGFGNQEIDFQEGGGSVENIDCVYNGSAPSTVVQFSGTRQVGKVNVPVGSINGIKVVLNTGTTLDSVWINSVFEAEAQIIRARDVEVRGAGILTNVCKFNAAHSGSNFHLLISDIVAAPTDVWVKCGTGIGSGTLKATRLIHTGGSPANLRSSGSGNFRPVISADECVNFIQSVTTNNLVTPAGVIKRIPIFSSGNSENGGSYRNYTGTLADNNSVLIPDTGASLNSALLVISFATSNSSHAIVAASNAGALIVAQPGTQFAVGTTADPGSGTYRVWKDTGGYRVKNNSGVSRNYTIMVIG